MPKKPGDLSHLGRTDPVRRDASHFGVNSGTSKTPSEVRNDHSESVRREHRQREDYDSGAYLRGAKHSYNGKEAK